MLLSTAMPIVIAAIVIVIISNGILSKPINPNIIAAANKLGIIPIIASFTERNKIINIKNTKKKEKNEHNEHKETNQKRKD